MQLRLALSLGQSRHTSFDWQSHARSAALLFAGMSCLVSRFQHKARARLIVENPLLPYFLRWLGAACSERA